MIKINLSKYKVYYKYFDKNCQYMKYVLSLSDKSKEEYHIELFDYGDIYISKFNDIIFIYRIHQKYLVNVDKNFVNEIYKREFGL